MAKFVISTKRLQIDKANASTAIAVAIAAFITVFALIAGRALLNQRSYQSRVITEREKAAKQLKANIKSVDTLVIAYKEFNGRPQNLLGGNTVGTGDRDGDNAKVILNALPSKYDFPALASSLEKLLIERNYKVNGITGTDDELAQAGNTESPTPTPVEIPFTVSVSGNYESIQELIGVTERSIRPIEIKKLNMTGRDNGIQLTFSAITYYQPAKNLSITKKEIR